jgi:hypothetical protein
MFDTENRIFIIDLGTMIRATTYVGALPEGKGDGTPNFMSLSALKKETISFRDDLISLGYLLLWLYLDGTLPWGQASSEEEMIEMKSSVSVSDLVRGWPGLIEYFRLVEGLNPGDTPDYGQLARALTRTEPVPESVPVAEPMTHLSLRDASKKTPVSKDGKPGKDPQPKKPVKTAKRTPFNQFVKDLSRAPEKYQEYLDPEYAGAYFMAKAGNIWRSLPDDLKEQFQ